MIDNSEKACRSWFVAAHDGCGDLVEAQYFHHAWYLDLIAAGGKFKGKRSQSKPFSTKDVVDNRRLKPILVCCLFPNQIFCELSSFPASPDGRAHARLRRSSCSWMIVLQWETFQWQWL